MFVDTKTSSFTNLGMLAMHRSQMKIKSYMYARQECRIMERGISKVSPQEGEQPLAATTGVSTAILRKGRLLKHTQLQASGS